MTDIPEGFMPFKRQMGFLSTNGPLYGCWDEDGLRLGFRVEERHCNPTMVCHGGMLSAFADMLLPLCSTYQANRTIGFQPTINLTCDFLAPAKLGAWVEGTGQLMRRTRNFLFAQGVATVDGEPVLRANGIFKIPSKAPEQAPDLAIEKLFGWPKA